MPASVRVYLCLSGCDMRKSFDSLHALVRDYLELDAYAGHLVVFASRRRDRVKIFYFDRDGFAIWSKRLEAGTYAIPAAGSPEQRQREITAQELGALLSGIDLTTAQRRKRYERKSGQVVQKHF
ncbi:MAG: IS66 family insertion sequence element accessory protein TnpB [Gammaproteobacteria bacterium]